jgi:hypothetical protein
MSTLAQNQFVNVCDDKPTPKMVCEDWVFRQCSYSGDNVGVYVSTSEKMSPSNNAVVNNNNNEPNKNNINNNDPNNQNVNNNDPNNQNNNNNDPNNQNNPVNGNQQPPPPNGDRRLLGSSSCTECNPLSDVGDCPMMDVVNPAFCTTWNGGNMDTTANPNGLFVPYHPNDHCPYENSEGMVNMTCCGARQMLWSEKLLAWLGLVGGIMGIVKTFLALISDQLPGAKASDGSEKPTTPNPTNQIEPRLGV